MSSKVSTTTNKRKRSSTTSSSNNQGTNKRKRSSQTATVRSTTSSSSKSPPVSKKLKTNDQKTQITDLPPEMIEQILARTLPSEWYELKKINPLFAKFISGKENRKRLIKQYAMSKGVSEEEAENIAINYINKSVLYHYYELERIYNGKYFFYDLMYLDLDKWEKYMTKHKLNKKFIRGYIFNYMYFHGLDENTIKEYLNIFDINEKTLQMNNILEYIVPSYHALKGYRNIYFYKNNKIKLSRFKKLHINDLLEWTVYLINDDVFTNEVSEKNLILLLILKQQIKDYSELVEMINDDTRLNNYYFRLSKFIPLLLSKLKPINNIDNSFHKYQHNVELVFMYAFSLSPLTQPYDDLINLLIQNPIIKKVFYSRFNFIDLLLNSGRSIPLTDTREMIISKIFRENTIDKNLMNKAFNHENVIQNPFIVDQIIKHKNFDPNIIKYISISDLIESNINNQNDDIIREHLKKWITNPKFKLYQWADNQTKDVQYKFSNSDKIYITKLLKLLNEHYPSLGRIVTYMTKNKVARGA